jgi:hypothetical protein
LRSKNLTSCSFTCFSPLFRNGFRLGASTFLASLQASQEPCAENREIEEPYSAYNWQHSKKVLMRIHLYKSEMKRKRIQKRPNGRGSFKRGRPCSIGLARRRSCAFFPTYGLAKTCEAQMTKSQETPIQWPQHPAELGLHCATSSPLLYILYIPLLL